MALINCPECGTKVSDKAASCVKCGAPISFAPNFGEIIVRRENSFNYSGRRCKIFLDGQQVGKVGVTKSITINSTIGSHLVEAYIGNKQFLNARVDVFPGASVEVVFNTGFFRHFSSISNIGQK